MCVATLKSLELIKKGEQKEKLIEFFEALDDDDDVQNIFSNADLGE